MHTEPPSWLIEPRSLRVLQGSSVTIDCMVKGFPSPQVTWKRLIKESDVNSDSTSLLLTSTSEPSSHAASSGQEQIDHVTSTADTSSTFVTTAHNKQYLLIRSGPNYQVYENGTLRISSATSSGEYLCAAANSIGPGISKVVKVTVNGKTHVY